MLIVIALLMIAVAFAAYSVIMMSWFKSSPSTEAASGTAVSSRAEAEDRLILDLRRLLHVEPGAAERMAEGLKIYRDRIRIAMPPTGEVAALATLFALYR